jgi:hypothetical protein
MHSENGTAAAKSKGWHGPMRAESQEVTRKDYAVVTTQ